MFPHEGNSVGGCIYQSDDYTPSKDGLLVYFNVQGRLEEATTLVSENGGQVISGNEGIGEHGFRSIVIDSEGNRIALHSM